MRFLPLIILAFALPAAAQQRITYYDYRYSTGTGFAVNNQGHIITNAHVVTSCRAISILTPRGEVSASLVDSDAAHDLAVLKTAYIAPQYASLRSDLGDLIIGDNVVIMGFPGATGARGEYQYKKTKVKALSSNIDAKDGPKTWMQLASVANHGNSGGPVLDVAGNVVGVISGMALTYKADRNKKPIGQPIGKYDIAVTLPVLEDFLLFHGIPYHQSSSGVIDQGDAYILSEARQFTVPVRCLLSITKR